MTGEYGETALHMAIRTGNLDYVKLLLDRGADMNHDSSFGPPLYYAVSLGHTSIVEELLKRGANPLIKTYIGETISL